jgi:hypothetical protein
MRRAQQPIAVRILAQQFQLSANDLPEFVVRDPTLVDAL